MDKTVVMDLAKRCGLYRPGLSEALMEFAGLVLEIAPASADNPSTAGAAKPTDLSHRLRETADQQPGWKSLLNAAAEEIERYYGGMMAWKQTAEKKDRDWQAERMGRVDDRIAARLAAPVAQSTAGAAKSGITSDYRRYVKKLEAHAMSLLDAATIYAFAYMQDEAEDEEDCVCGEEQHERAKAVFAAIKSLDKVLAAPAAQAPAQVPTAAEVRTAVARAIWNIRREDEDRCDMELEDMGDEHSVWAEADAAIRALRTASKEGAAA